MVRWLVAVVVSVVPGLAQVREGVVLGVLGAFKACLEAEVAQGRLPGAVATALDYYRFLQALLNGGTLEGKRILSPKSVALMTADHLGPLYLPSLQRGAPYLPGPGYGFGLGFAVRLEDGGNPLPGSKGDYFWAGLFGTYFFVDPKERLIGVFMTQSPGGRTYYAQLFRNAVYASLR